MSARTPSARPARTVGRIAAALALSAALAGAVAAPGAAGHPGHTEARDKWPGTATHLAAR